MTTIKDIADRLGVSSGTVSKGLNGANDISEACFDVCMNKHFQEVLNVATNLQYLIVIGKATKLHVAKFLHHDNPDKYTWYSTNLNGKDVKVLYADHNAGGGTVKKFAEL